jgi:hypothetical protein
MDGSKTVRDLFLGLSFSPSFSFSVVESWHCSSEILYSLNVSPRTVSCCTRSKKTAAPVFIELLLPLQGFSAMPRHTRRFLSRHCTKGALAHGRATCRKCDIFSEDFSGRSLRAESATLFSCRAAGGLCILKLGRFCRCIQRQITCF